VVRWYELLPATLTRRQEGSISNASNFVFNGAISPSMVGNEAVIQYNVGGSSQLPQIRASSRRSAMALGSMTGEVVLGTSAAAAQDFSGPKGTPPACRWGDYAGATPDPNPLSTHLVWGTNQLIGTAAGTNPRWTTRNFALLANADPASFTVSPNPAFTAKVINFDASGSTGPVTKYEWDLDGDGVFETDTGTVNHTSRTYTQPGAFGVQLRVTEAGTTDTTTRPLTIKSGTPTAAFTAPAVFNRGQAVSFDGSGSTDAEARGGIESYQWDFDGDGVTDQTTTGPVVTHAYTTLGTFNPRLVVSDADDHQLSPAAAQAVTVQNVAPTAQVTFAPAAPETGKAVSFSAAGATDPDGTIVNYRWDLNGDGVFETDTGTANHTSRTYSTAGTFPVAVRVQDNDGATATRGSSVRVVKSTLKLTLKFSRKPRLATLLNRGLAGSVKCTTPCTVRLTLRISRKVARQMKSPEVIGTVVVVLKSSAKTVHIRPTSGARKQLRSARSFAITVTGTATDSTRLSARRNTTVQVKR
jgi:PKD repeat protein